MAYGDYDGPVKADKGKEGGACNRTSCQNSPAIWYNHGSHAWYCNSCRRDIQFDSFNLREWQENWLPKRGHPMFETREMITAREAEARRKKYTLGTTPTESEELNRVIADVARMVPGECLMLDSRDLVGAKSIYHNDVEFTPSDRVLGNIIGSAYTHSLRRDVTNGNAIIERHEDTGVRRYSAPDDRIRMEYKGIPLESVGLDGLSILHSDGRKEPLTGFVQHNDETMAGALTRTATEMNATIIYEPHTDAPD